MKDNPMRVSVGGLVITPTNELPVEYSTMLDGAKTLEQLQEGMLRYQAFAHDACEIVASMSEGKFGQFRRAMAKERKGKYSGDGTADWVSVILMPEAMFRISLVASRFGAPWGVAFLQMNNAGLIQIENEIVTVKGKTVELEDGGRNV